ncbi:MAG TPA: transglycosylase SLT domain-containing protein, partial [Caldilineaceae bacterium]|nr:transglycosylase SLT domain-containing protein [Caldilineaceae bacterium]
EPAPTSSAAPAQPQPQAPIVRPEDVTAPQGQPEVVDGVPVVRADQVTAPGEPLPPAAQTPLLPAPGVAPPAGGQTALAPAPNPAQANRQQMTYAQMFQEVASRYDLSWQMLAAQAYVESGFDSLALSSAGDMGLMQIRPSTWREWAPALQASDPFDSYSNVLVAAAYLDYLRTLLSERGYPQTEWMLVAYNWGPDQVLEHLEAGGTWESLAPERRQYALDILQIAATIPAN